VGEWSQLLPRYFTRGENPGTIQWDVVWAQQPLWTFRRREKFLEHWRHKNTEFKNDRRWDSSYRPSTVNDRMHKTSHVSGKLASVSFVRWSPTFKQALPKLTWLSYSVKKPTKPDQKLLWTTYLSAKPEVKTVNPVYIIQTGLICSRVLRIGPCRYGKTHGLSFLATEKCVNCV
jgi:hypothetical protein